LIAEEKPKILCLKNEQVILALGEEVQKRRVMTKQQKKMDQVGKMKKANKSQMLSTN
jgi:hypothetical protein